METVDSVFHPLFATPPSGHASELALADGSDFDSAHEVELVARTPRAPAGLSLRESGYISESEVTSEPRTFDEKVRDSIKSSESRDSCMSDETVESNSPKNASNFDLTASDDSSKRLRGSQELVSKKPGLLSQVFRKRKETGSRPASIHHDQKPEQIAKEGTPLQLRIMHTYIHI